MAQRIYISAMPPTTSTAPVWTFYQAGETVKCPSCNRGQGEPSVGSIVRICVVTEEEKYKRRQHLGYITRCKRCPRMLRLEVLDDILEVP